MRRLEAFDLSLPMYPLARKLLFQLDAEKAHEFTLNTLRQLARLRMTGILPPAVAAPVELLGMSFPNAVGLAAGLDKNGECIDAFADMGFGFIEVGTVTPRPQPGNPKPRMFRLEPAGAIINRLGFNNQGVDYLLRRVEQARYQGILGINIGKNFDTPNEKANDDYLHCLRKVYSAASYVTVNISSPNTKGLRELQHGSALQSLLQALKQEQAVLENTHGRYVPILLKIAPDNEPEQLAHMANTIRAEGMDGIIATNTTFSRSGVESLPHADEVGGMSGAPLMAASTQVLQAVRAEVGAGFPLIGVGGISSADDAVAKVAAGADLVQIYSGFIYHGPPLIRAAARAIADVPA